MLMTQTPIIWENELEEESWKKNQGEFEKETIQKNK